MITAAVDSRIGSPAILGMMAIADEVAATLTLIPVTQTFWGLQFLGPRPPLSNTVDWQVWRAWELLMGIRGVNIAVAHKTLHHKRPWLFPMLDNKTSEAMGGSKLWATIHGDITTNHAEFVELEEWFATLASRRGGVQLTRLRIHDILLWGYASRNGTGLATAGQEVLGIGPEG